MVDPAYQPATELWQHYHPDSAPHAFPHSDASARSLSLWQEETRAVLAATIGFQEAATVEPAATHLNTVDKGDYMRHKVAISTAAHTRMPVYLLIPKIGTSPYPSVLALHGHGYGAKDIVGLWEDGSERDTPDGYHRDFAVTLCRAGFAVAAPEISCFGERQSDYSYLDTEAGQPIPTTCEQTAALALYLGGTVIGLRVRDGIRLVDYLQTRDEFDTDRLGAMGISGGGMHTLFSAAIDTRIRAAVISGYFSTFKDSVLAMQHCPCNIVPGLSAFGEMSDLAGLIAPRPLFIESGSHDPIFPVNAARRGTDELRRVYGAFGAASNVGHSIFEGRHRIDGEAAYDFLRNALAGA